MDSAEKVESEAVVRQVASKTAWGADDARFVLRAQTDSGLTVTAFSKLYGLAPQRIHGWRSKLKAQAMKGVAATPSAFLPVRLVSSPRPSPQAMSIANSAMMEVVLSGGQRVRLERDFDGNALSRLLKVLREVEC